MLFNAGRPAAFRQESLFIEVARSRAWGSGFDQRITFRSEQFDIAQPMDVFDQSDF